MTCRGEALRALVAADTIRYRRGFPLGARRRK